MSTGTLANTTTTDEAARSGYPRRQTVLRWGSVFALFVVAIGMRLYDLGLPFDRDGYDEGVYWQSLLATTLVPALTLSRLCAFWQHALVCEIWYCTGLSIRAAGCGSVGQSTQRTAWSGSVSPLACRQPVLPARVANHSG